MIRIVLALAVLIVTVAAVEARTCNTTCNTYGGQTSCTTQCW